MNATREDEAANSAITIAIEALRKERGLTMLEMSEHLDMCNVSQYSKKVRGRHSWTAHDLRRAFAMGVSAQVLLGGVDGQKAASCS